MGYKKTPPKVFCKKNVLKNVCWSLLFFKKNDFIKKIINNRCFTMQFAKICKNTYLKNICEWLPLRIARHYIKKPKYGVISGPYFPLFGLNTEKYGPEITPYLDNFHKVRFRIDLLSIQVRKYTFKWTWRPAINNLSYII